MKNLLKLLTLFLIIIVLAGCGLIESKSETNQSTAEIFGGTPVSWLYYKDNKYVFNRVIPNDEIDMTLIEPTNIKTKMGDGWQHGVEIYLYKKDNSLFIIDKGGPIEEWANYTKN